MIEQRTWNPERQPTSYVLWSPELREPESSRIVRGANEVVRFMRANSAYISEHNERASKDAVELMKRLGLDSDTISINAAAIRVHDVGEIGCKDLVELNGPLTSEQLDIVKQHPLVGAQIVIEKFSVPEIVPVILYHHERWDGAGYPYGLRGEAIPLSARICTIVDCWDACTTDHGGRPAASFYEAITYMCEETTNGRFDPNLASLFITMKMEEHAMPLLERVA